jgi:signal transduction histidine kinase
MTQSFNLETEKLESLFPFFFALDKNLQIVKKGNSLKKISGNEVNFINQFSFVRPSLGIFYEFNSIIQFQEQVFVLNILGNDKKVRLKGQFIYDDIANLLYFWGSPYINSEKDFENIGLQIKDYAIFDWNLSFLQVNKFLQIEQEDKAKLKFHFDKQKNFYELLFDYIPMDVAIFDSELKYVYINRSAIKNDELRNWLKGKSYVDYCKFRNLDLSIAEEREGNFRNVLNEGQTFFYEETYHKGTTEEKTVFRKMMPYTSLNNEKYILAYGIDITTVKKANEEIFIKNKELNKLNLELDGLVYSVTHDIRSPLHAVLGLIDVIEREEELNFRANEYIALIKSSIKRLDETINLIFDYSRNARTEVQSVEIDLITLIDEVFTYIFNYHNKDIKLIVNKNGNCKFYSDPQRVRIIIYSLISNAIMFSRKDVASYVDINISLDRKNCVIEVSDNGEGIQEKHQKMIFDMFYRASKKSAGSGLGLFICKEAVEKLNGTIHFTSIPDKGSNFIVKLPNDLFLHEKEIHSNRR